MGSQQSPSQGPQSSEQFWQVSGPSQTLSPHSPQMSSWTQPSSGSQESSVQSSKSSHGLSRPEHSPLAQVSSTVQMSPSSQIEPLAAEVVPHAPVAASQTFTSHWPMPSWEQVTTVAGSTAHRLAWHTRVPLHRSPSSRSAQSASASHGHLLSPASHTPPAHWSPTVQVEPSLQAEPSAAATMAHSPVSESQVLARHSVSRESSHRICTCSSTTQKPSSPQSIASKLHQSSGSSQQSESISQGHSPSVPVQMPPSQWSSLVQSLPSSHTELLSVNAQPSAGSQLSSVHSLKSSHESVSPLPQAPAIQ